MREDIKFKGSDRELDFWLMKFLFFGKTDGGKSRQFSYKCCVLLMFRRVNR